MRPRDLPASIHRNYAMMDFNYATISIQNLNSKIKCGERVTLGPNKALELEPRKIFQVECKRDFFKRSENRNSFRSLGTCSLEDVSARLTFTKQKLNVTCD